ncbi:hypothetical protein [Mycobacterium sp.]|uniref:hypothetical protein n=1 Tax=Mycobacterium sp. TaxID=1785 RepID=UPI003D0FCA2C
MPKTLASVLDAYLRMKPEVKPLVLRSYQETWPRMTEVLVNGLNESFSNGALTVVNDPDDFSPRWVLATLAGNVRCELGSPILYDRRLLESMSRVNKTSQVVTDEFASSVLDLDRLSSRIGWQNFRASLKSVGQFVDGHFDSVLGFLESLSADHPS